MADTIAEVFGEKSKDGDELVAHTLQSIANMPRGEGEDILYRILKESGDTTYIHQSLSYLVQLLLVLSFLPLFLPLYHPVINSPQRDVFPFIICITCTVKNPLS